MAAFRRHLLFKSHNKRNQQGVLMKFVFAALISVLSVNVFAAEPEVFNAVLKAPEVTSMISIDKLEVVATYRCPGCYDVEVTGQRPGFTAGTTRLAAVVIRTEANLANRTVTTTLISQSK
jgi:hypothetical protein